MGVGVIWMKQAVQEEVYGNLLLNELMTSIWFGDWDQYEEIMSQLPENLLEEFPFHQYYNREEISLWYDNYFKIPGAYFIPPYLSSYNDRSAEAQEKSRQDVLCLIGEYEKFGFYYPLDQDQFPDHFGSITAFITATLKEEIKAIQANDDELILQLNKLKQQMYVSYLAKGIFNMTEHAKGKVEDQFFQEFLTYYAQNMKQICG